MPHDKQPDPVDSSNRPHPDADETGGRLEVPPREGPAQEKPAAPRPDRNSQATRQKEEEREQRKKIERRTPEM